MMVFFFEDFVGIDDYFFVGDIKWVFFYIVVCFVYFLDYQRVFQFVVNFVEVEVNYVINVMFDIGIIEIVFINVYLVDEDVCDFEVGQNVFELYYNVFCYSWFVDVECCN